MQRQGRIKLSQAVVLSLLVVLFAGCGSQTRLIRPGMSDVPTVEGLSNNDFEQAASEVVQSMLRSGSIDRNDGKKNILVISSILNDSMQRIDTDQLIKKIRIELLQSGKVKTTTAIGLNGSEDVMNQKYSQLSSSKKVNKSTLVRQRFTAPNLSLSGRIFQKNNRINSSLQLTEYYFQLTLTDLSDGLGVWEGEVAIGKETSSNSVSW